MKITFFSTQSYDKQYFNACNQTHELHYVDALLDENTVLLAQNSQVVCAFVNDKLNANVISTLAQMGVGLVAMRCAGYNNVDLNAAHQHGLTVVRVPAYSPHAVAEHTLALILTLNRKTHKAYNRVREGNFSLERLMGFDLFGKTVGVIGTGKIGMTFCRIMRGLGCSVLAYDVAENEELLAEGIQYTSLTALLEASDIVSLHCPLNDATRHLINEQSLQKMKKGAMLINTGRGGLIDTKAVIQSLKTGHLGYLGLDVYEQEDKLFFRDFSESIIQDELILRLMSFPNVLVTAHQAFFTDEAMTEIAQTTLQSVDCFEKGAVLAHKVG
ncbi:MAG: 2-hydroxyacid dehydrogenase [Spirosomaceae bacterium]|jgi:D-lactate dehydrogenase|nr:2-hydroxyacid dehydrogenase [Spirosomataceae bacterium]